MAKMDGNDTKINSFETKLNCNFILRRIIIFQIFLRILQFLGTRRSRNRRLNSNSRIVRKLGKVGQRESSLRWSKSPSNSSDYKARSPCGDRVREFSLSLSLSSVERKLAFYGRPRMRGMALYRGPSTCRRRRFDRDSKYRFDRARRKNIFLYRFYYLPSFQPALSNGRGEE